MADMQNDHAARIASLEHKVMTVDRTVNEIRDHFSEFMSEMHDQSTMLQRLLTQFDEREKRALEMVQDHRQAFERFDARIQASNKMFQEMAIDKASTDAKLNQIENFQKLFGAISVGLAVEFIKRLLDNGN